MSHSRVGQRGGLASAARSEHEVSEIIDGISEQEVSTHTHKHTNTEAMCILTDPKV